MLSLIYNKVMGMDLFSRKFIAVAIGNLMEWYDFAIFGAFADVIAEEFFPVQENNEDSIMSLIKAFTVFGSAFLARPLGGLIMGYIGDIYGRKRALEVSVGMMLVVSVLMGCIPNYDTIGNAAPCILVLLRICQGIAAGGELIGAFLYIIEATEGINQGFWGGACKATGNCGVAVGIGVATLLRYNLNQEQLYLFGWRIAFWSGLVIGSMGFTLRVLFLPDDITDLTPQYAYTEAIRDSESNDIVNTEMTDSDTNMKPILTESTILYLAKDSCHHLAIAFKFYYKEIICLILICPVWNCGYYTVFIWLGYYLSSEDMNTSSDHEVPNIWIIMFVLNAALIVLLPLQGALADWCTKAYQTYTIKRTPILNIQEENSPMLEMTDSNAITDDALKVTAKKQNVTAPSDGVTLILMVSAGWLFVFAIPCMLMISTRQLPLILIGICTLGLCVGTFGAVLPSYLVYIIPKRSLRYVILGISYNIASCVFAGTAAVAQTALVMRANVEGVNSGIYVGIYFSCIAAVSLLAQYYMNNHSSIVKTCHINSDHIHVTENPMNETNSIEMQEKSIKQSINNVSEFKTDSIENSNDASVKSPLTDPQSGLTPNIETTSTFNNFRYTIYKLLYPAKFKKYAERYRENGHDVISI